MNDSPSTMSPTYDAMSMSTNVRPLSDFLAQKIAQVKEQGSASNDFPSHSSSSITLVTFDAKLGKDFKEFDVDNDPDGFIEMIKNNGLGEWFEPSDDFCASPIYTKDAIYELSVDPEIIKIAE